MEMAPEAGVRVFFSPQPRSRVPHTPDFLWSLVGSMIFMRISLREAHTRSCPEPYAGNSGHLAHFSRDVGYHGSSPLTYSQRRLFGSLRLAPDRKHFVDLL
jgi:hypothetical protein